VKVPTPRARPGRRTSTAGSRTTRPTTASRPAAPTPSPAWPPS
jgi:hypothetical protein